MMKCKSVLWFCYIKTLVVRKFLYMYLTLLKLCTIVLKVKPYNKKKVASFYII